MVEIYRRFDNYPANGGGNPQNRNYPGQAPRQGGGYPPRANQMAHPAKDKELASSVQTNKSQPCQPKQQGMPQLLSPHKNENCEEKNNTSTWSNNKHKKRGGFLNSILPASLYNAETGKLFGVLKAEDLLIVALIFLLMEKDGEDNSIMILALLYVLISDYIEFPELSL